MSYSPPRPVQPAKPAKPVGLLAGVGVAGALCLILAGLSGWLWTQRGAGQSALAVHEGRIKEVAEALGQLPADTNTPPDAALLWDKIAATAKSNRADLEKANARVAELEAQLDELVLAQAQAQQQQADAQRRATELAAAQKNLDELRTSTSRQIEELKAQLASLQGELESARAASASVAAAASVPPEAPAAPAATTAATPPADAAGDAVAAEPAEAEPAAGQVEDGAESFTFPPNAKDRLFDKALYNASSADLILVLSDGTRLRYPNAPASVFSSLTSAPVPATYVRMRILGTLPCEQDDRAAVRAAAGRR